MPTYEFSCPICNARTEQVFSVYSNHVIFCADCNVQMDKRFSSPSIHFKGDGFYKTGG